MGNVAVANSCMARCGDALPRSITGSFACCLQGDGVLWMSRAEPGSW